LHLGGEGRVLRAHRRDQLLEGTAREPLGGAPLALLAEGEPQQRVAGSTAARAARTGRRRAACFGGRQAGGQRPVGQPRRELLCVGVGEVEPGEQGPPPRRLGLLRLELEQVERLADERVHRAVDRRHRPRLGGGEERGAVGVEGGRVVVQRRAQLLSDEGEAAGRSDGALAPVRCDGGEELLLHTEGNGAARQLDQGEQLRQDERVAHRHRQVVLLEGDMHRLLQRRGRRRLASAARPASAARRSLADRGPRGGDPRALLAVRADRGADSRLRLGGDEEAGEAEELEHLCHLRRLVSGGQRSDVAPRQRLGDDLPQRLVVAAAVQEVHRAGLPLLQALGPMVCAERPQGKDGQRVRRQATALCAVGHAARDGAECCRRRGLLLRVREAVEECGDGAGVARGEGGGEGAAEHHLGTHLFEGGGEALAAVPREDQHSQRRLAPPQRPPAALK